MRTCERVRRAVVAAVVLLSVLAFLPSTAGAGITWQRTWGLNVDRDNPSTGLEVCTVRLSCQGGSAGGVGGAVFPQGVAVAPSSGHVFVTEYAGNRVQEFDATGAFVRLWGKDVIAGNGSTGFEVCTVAADCKVGEAGTAGGEFTQPYGVAVGPAGHVYVAETTNSRVQEFTATGGFVRAWGRDVSASTAGTGLEVCTVASDCKEALVTSTASGGGKGGFLAFPAGIAVDADGYVYVANQSGRRIERFTPAAAFDRAWGQGVLTANGAAPEVCTVAADCTTGGSLGGEGGNVGLPIGVAVDSNANVYVFEAIAYRVEKFTAQGTFLRAWGKNVDAVAGGTGFEVCTVSANCKRGETGTLGGEFLNPSAGPNAPASNAVAVDASGTVYVTDREAARIQAFGSDGAFQTTFGTGVNAVDDPSGGFQNCTVAAHCGSGTQDGFGGGMQTPTGIAATPGGTVYEADQIGQRVQAYAPCTGSSVVSLSSTAYAVDEGDGNAEVTLQRTGDTSCAASVKVATANGTATAGSDYTATLSTFSVPAGATSQTVQIPVTDDNALEVGETFTVTLSQPGAGVTLGTPTAATVTIADDDALETLRFTSDTKTVSETGGSVALTVQRGGDQRGAQSVHYATANGSAKNGSDYTVTQGTLSFVDGEASKTVEVPILDDGVPEDDEQFTVTLSAPSGNAVIGTPGTATVTITDNDLIDTTITSGPDGYLTDLRFRFFLFVANPAAGSTFSCSLDGATPAPCTNPFDPGAALPDGPHTFSVRAINANGDVDPTPETRSFTVDTVRPTTSVATYGTQLPLGAWSGPVQVRALATDANPGSGVSEVRCAVDPVGAPPQTASELRDPCPVTVSQPGAHTVYAAAIDRAGNAGIPAVARFTIAQPPDTEITSGPSGSTSSLPAVFAFRAIPGGGTLECQLDNAPYAPCVSPRSLPTLERGAHVFRVRTISPDGETDPTPASRSFTLEDKIIKSDCSGPIPFGEGVKFDPNDRFHIVSVDLGGRRCKPLTATCPEGSVCTLSARVSVVDDDIKTPWYGGMDIAMRRTASGYDVGDTSDSRGCYATKAEADETFDSTTAKNCPRTASITTTGPRQVTTACEFSRPYYGAGYHQAGPDRSRQGTCEATLVITPATLLSAIATSPRTAGIYAPGAGTVTLSAAGKTSGRAGLRTTAGVAAAKKKKKKPAPVVATTRKKVTTAGFASLPLKLSKTTATTLRRKKRVTLNIVVTFAPSGGGEATTRRQRLTLITPAVEPKPKKVKQTAANARPKPRR